MVKEIEEFLARLPLPDQYKRGVDRVRKAVWTAYEAGDLPMEIPLIKEADGETYQVRGDVMYRLAENMQGEIRLGNDTFTISHTQYKILAYLGDRFGDRLRVGDIGTELNLQFSTVDNNIGYLRRILRSDLPPDTHLQRIIGSFSTGYAFTIPTEYTYDRTQKK